LWLDAPAFLAARQKGDPSVGANRAEVLMRFGVTSVVPELIDQPFESEHD
jgi:hypothetical protein